MNVHILQRQPLETEFRPGRKEMLEMFANGISMRTGSAAVCKGNCIYCDGDAGCAADALSHTRLTEKAYWGV